MQYHTPVMHSHQGLNFLPNTHTGARDQTNDLLVSGRPSLTPDPQKYRPHFDGNASKNGLWILLMEPLHIVELQLPPNGGHHSNYITSLAHTGAVTTINNRLFVSVFLKSTVLSWWYHFVLFGIFHARSLPALSWQALSWQALMCPSASWQCDREPAWTIPSNTWNLIQSAAVSVLFQIRSYRT